MQSSVQVHLFLVCRSAALEFAQNFVGFLGMDFVFGVLLYGRFSPVFVLGLSFVFAFGLLYHCNYLIKFLCDFSVGFCSKCCSGEVCASKAVSCEQNCLISLENLQSQKPDGFLLNKVVKEEDAIEGKDDNDEETDDETVISCTEDEVFDVVSLRKLVKIERRRWNLARAELEKERMAAASAAEEAMAMILRLQNEKSSTEIQANHYRQIAEQKQQYDEEMIQHLQWIIMKHESDRSLLEEQLRLCRQKRDDQFEEGDPRTDLFDSTFMENLCRQKRDDQFEEGDPRTNLFDSTFMENSGLEDVFGANSRGRIHLHTDESYFRMRCVTWIREYK